MGPGRSPWTILLLGPFRCKRPALSPEVKVISDAKLLLFTTSGLVILQHLESVWMTIACFNTRVDANHVLNEPRVETLGPC